MHSPSFIITLGHSVSVGCFEDLWRPATRVPTQEGISFHLLPSVACPSFPNKGVKWKWLAWNNLECWNTKSKYRIYQYQYECISINTVVSWCWSICPEPPLLLERVSEASLSKVASSRALFASRPCSWRNPTSLFDTLRLRNHKKLPEMLMHCSGIHDSFMQMLQRIRNWGFMWQQLLIIQTHSAAPSVVRCMRAGKCPMHRERKVTLTPHLHLRNRYSMLRQGGGLVEEPCQLICLRGFSTHNSEGPGVFAQVQIVLLPGALLHRDSICKDNGEKRKGAKKSD